MYLDAEEVFGLPRDRKGRLEGDDAVDVRHGGLAHEGVTVPCSAVLPRQVVGGLAVLHDGRDAVVVVRRHGIVAGSLRFCVFVVCQFLLPLSQFALQFLYPGLVGVVLLPVNGGVFHARFGNLLQQGGVLILQSLYLRLEGGDLVLGFLYHPVQFRGVQFIVRHGGLHGAVF